MKLKKILFAAALVIFLGALGYLGFIGYSYYMAGKAYDELEETVVTRPEAAAAEEETKEETQWEPLTIDFGALRAVSEDIVLWLDIPGTDVSYPVARGQDNDYYLKRKLDGSYSFAGTVFMDFRNAPDCTDDNTILYGHNMRNGSMFGTLKKYREESYFEEHPEIDLYLPDRILRCKVMSAHQEEAEEENFPLRFETKEEKLSYINGMKSKAYYDTGITPDAQSRLITLVTCTGNGYTHRWVVQAAVTEEILMEHE